MSHKKTKLGAPFVGECIDRTTGKIIDLRSGKTIKRLRNKKRQ
jgi:hypothetical protein